MNTMNSPVEEIKNRLDIADFIGTYVQLKRAGANFKANCPFHNEKTPSFMVSRAKQFWYCFGACSEGGDIFKFVMKMEGLEFPEALKILADKAGITLPKYNKQAENKKNILRDILNAATDFYAKQLHEPHGMEALKYLTGRGLSDAIIKTFSLGYAPDSWDALVKELCGVYAPQDVLDAGLILKKQRADILSNSQLSAHNLYFDRFRHRIMFPIRDVHGATVGFTSRILDETRKEGKYVNTPETPVYSKSRVLYGLDLAREQIRKSDYVVIVEGNMDVITCHQFGMLNVVASSGTALTFEQVRLIKRYTNNIKMAFDADSAGQSAAKRGIDLALAEGMQIKVISIPKSCGKDPDECIRKDYKVWESAVRAAQEVIDFYLTSSRARYDLHTAHGRTQYVNEILREISKIPDLVAQDFWIKRLSSEVDIDEKILRAQILKFSVNENKTPVQRRIGPPTAPVKDRLTLITERLLALFLCDERCAGEIISNVLPEMLARGVYRELYINMTACYNSYNTEREADKSDLKFRQFWRIWSRNKDPKILSTADPDNRNEFQYWADILELYCDREFENWSISALQSEVGFLLTEVKREYIKNRREILAREMRAAEQSGDRARVEDLAREFKQLN